MTNGAKGLGWLLALGLLPAVAIAQNGPLAKIAGSEGGGRVTAVAVGGFHGCGLASNGGVECWGANGFGQLDGAPNGSVGDSSRLPGPYLAVSAGDLHSCALKADGGVDCWGRNQDGQLDGTPGSANSGSRAGPYLSVSAGHLHSCGVRPGGSVDCWGRNDHGQLDGTPNGAVSATREGPYLQVSAGRHHSCGLKANGGVDCWGDNSNGQLDGSPDAGVHATSKPGPYVEVSAGLYNSCAVRTGGRTECWGSGGAGASGHPHYAQSSVAAALQGAGSTGFGQISAGNAHTCQVRRDGALACWGSDANGQAMPPAELSGLVANGEIHSCAIIADGTVRCWGADQAGAFGSPAPGDTFRRLALGPQGIACGLKSDGSVQCWHPVLGQTSSFAGSYRTLSVAGLQACAIQADGSAQCWIGNTATPLLGHWQDVQLGLNHACGLQADGTLSCWGDNGEGQTSNVPVGSFGALSVGYNHACAISGEGTLACWGSNVNGQATPPGGRFVQVVAGNTYSCAIRDNGVRACWGDDTHGQAPQLALDPVVLDPGQSGQGYGSVQLQLLDAGRNADGDYLPPEPAFAVVGGALPNGLSLAADGVLSGTPSAGGTFHFDVEGEDANGFVASRSYALVINGPQQAGSCAEAGYTGLQLDWCRNICEKGYTGSQLKIWIRRWMDRYHDVPYCLAEPQPQA